MTSRNALLAGVLLLGLMVGVLLGSMTYRAQAAAENPLSVVETLETSYYYQQVVKVYDKNNDTTCYVVYTYKGAGISCLK